MSLKLQRRGSAPAPVSVPARALVSSEEWRLESKKAGGKILPIRKEIALVEAGTGGSELVDYVLSSEAVDRPGDTIKASGWRDDNYAKNPVILFGHDYGSLPVGRMTGARAVDGARYVGKGVEFTPRDLYPFGHMVGGLVRGGYLPAGSVGFQPLKWAFNEERGGVDFLEQELLEFSVVPVPANPEALVAAKSAGIDVALLCGWAEKILDGGAKVLVPREQVEIIRKTLAPKSFQVARGMDDMEDEGEDESLSAEDFARQMVEHHKAALDMADAFLAGKPEDAVLVPIAEAILKTQAEEIATLEKWLDDNVAEGKAATPRTKDEDPLVSAVERLERALCRSTEAMLAHTQAVKAGHARPALHTSATPEVRREVVVNAPPGASADEIAAKVRRAMEQQLSAALGRMD